MAYFELNHFEMVWLNTHGGRIPRDVHVDKKGKYVWMTNGYEMVKVRIPNE